MPNENAVSLSSSTRNRAWVWNQRGGPESLVLENREVPTPGVGEVLVANEAVGLNPVDWKFIEWGSDAWKPGHVPGLDGAGVVVATGPSARVPLGARVAYHQALSRDGSFADYTAVDARSTFSIPQKLDAVVAAAMPCSGLTAHEALQKVPTRAGRDVLITGASGSVGFLLAQLAVRGGYRVWATGTLANREALLAAGVSGVFDYRDDEWRARLALALGARRLHAIVDTVGGAHAASLASAIGYNGHLVCIQDRLEEHPLPAFSTAISLHEVALNSIFGHGSPDDWKEWQRAAADLLSAVATGALQPPPIEVGSFMALPAALTALKNAAGRAKFVVTLREQA